MWSKGVREKALKQTRWVWGRGLDAAEVILGQGRFSSREGRRICSFGFPDTGEAWRQGQLKRVGRSPSPREAYPAALDPEGQEP